MPYDVLIRRNADGETRVCRMGDIDWGEGSRFWWTEGNASCDCNRHLFFERARDPQYDDGPPCGEQRYTALAAYLPDGTRIELGDR